MIKRIGFTGTRSGMTERQRWIIDKLIVIMNPDEIHHGDCVGADFHFHNIIEELNDKHEYNIKKIGHPPSKDTSRAYCTFDEVRLPGDYLVRNRNIVNEVDFMIGNPKNYENVNRGSGTWYTIRYSIKTKTPLIIVFPDGTWRVKKYDKKMVE